MAPPKGPRIPITAEDVACVVLALRAGTSLTEACAEIHRAVSAMRRYLKELGYPTRPDRAAVTFTRDDVEAELAKRTGVAEAAPKSAPPRSPPRQVELTEALLRQLGLLTMSPSEELALASKLSKVTGLKLGDCRQAVARLHSGTPTWLSFDSAASPLQSPRGRAGQGVRRLAGGGLT